VTGAGSAEAFVPWLRQLKQTIGIAPSLSAVGVKREQIGRLVDLAVKDICHQTNPRKVEAADFERFFGAAL
jgi:alcohol dehydrogenase class IV